MKKVTLQEVATSLGISRTTVLKVFSGHEGVSDSLKSRIIAKAQELGYEFPEDFPLDPLPEDEPPVNIAVAVCRPETSLFWMNIIHQIAKEFSSRNINLVYVYLPTSIDESYILPPALTGGTVHGMIVLNVYNPRLLHLLADARIPKVFLDTADSVPPEELNGDMILMENKNSVYKLTSHMIEQGRKSFGFIGDVSYAKSNHQRYDGFLKALDDHGILLDPSMTLTTPIGIDTYREEIESFLESLSKMPDAFVCANDHVACILLQLLEKRGLRVPQDVAVSGFDKNIENPLSESLTTAEVPTMGLGLRLATQILFRIQHPDEPFEVIYLATKVLFCSSTES